MPVELPTEGDDDVEEQAVLKRFKKSLSPSGGGGGVSLHFDADVAEEYKLDPDTEVEVDVVAEDGDVTFEIRDIPAGFTRAAFERYADDQNWTQTDAYLAEDEWSLTYRDATGLVKIETDSNTHIDGAPVNNVIVQSVPLEIGEDLERYHRLCMTANQRGCRVRVRDSDGLWTRLQSSPEADTGDAPDRETFEQLLDRTEHVRIQLVDEYASLNATLDEIGSTVGVMRDVMSEFDDAITVVEQGVGPGTSDD